MICGEDEDGFLLVDETRWRICSGALLAAVACVSLFSEVGILLPDLGQ